jgi:hypothetical protein
MGILGGAVQRVLNRKLNPVRWNLRLWFAKVVNDPWQNQSRTCTHNHRDMQIQTSFAVSAIFHNLTRTLPQDFQKNPFLRLPESWQKTAVQVSKRPCI